MVELLPPGPQLGVFVGAVLVLALTPGPALFYILATSIAQGTRAGVISVLGIATGTLVHVVMAVFGPHRRATFGRMQECRSSARSRHPVLGGCSGPSCPYGAAPNRSGGEAASEKLKSPKA